MAQALSQDEVDALLQGVASDKVPVAVPPAANEARDRSQLQGPLENLKPYDFTRSEISTRGRLPGLEIIFSKFTRRLHNIFASELGKSVDAGLQNMDVVLYENLIKRFPLPSSIHVVRLEPLRGMGVFVIEAGLAYAMIDIFFGGAGQQLMKAEGRDFTRIEANFLGKFVEKMLRGMEEAWHPVIQLTGNYIRSEINPYLLGASGLGDVMVVATYRIDMSQVAGNILFSFPLSAVEEFRDRLKSSLPVAEEREASGMVTRLQGPLLGVEVSVQAVVDVVDLSLRQILSLHQGDLLQVNGQGLDQVELWVEGKPKFQGRGAQKNGSKVFVVSKRCS